MMSIDHLLSLVGLCIPLVLSVTGAAIRICGKLEKISAVLENMITKAECAALRQGCPARHQKAEISPRKRADASGSPSAAARRKRSRPRD